MLITKRRPASVGEILVEEFLEPMGLTQGALAEAMGVPRKHVNELCNDRRGMTAPTALILARVFGNSPEFWLNVQRRRDLWEAMHSPRERERIDRARSIEIAPLEAQVEPADLRRAFVDEAKAAAADVDARGPLYAMEDVAAYMRARIAGKAVTKPEPIAGAQPRRPSGKGRTTAAKRR